MTTTNQNTTSSHRTPSCPLEALNTGTLLDILSACNSVADLGSLILTSPIIYNTFLLAKAATLRRVLANELGPVIRDAAILAQTDRFDGEDFENRLALAVSNYRRVRLLPDDSEQLWKWFASLPIETLAKMARHTRTVAYFTNLYVDIRMHHFQQTLSTPSSNWTPITPTERRRIAQALLRFQILANLYGGRVWGGPSGRKHDLFLTTTLPLFAPWELEQTAEMDQFISGLCGALRRCEKAHPSSGGGPIPASLQRSEDYHNQYYPNLEAFRAKLIAAGKSDGGLMDEIKALLEGSYPRLGLSLFEWLTASHRYQRYSEDSPLAMKHLNEPAVSEFNGESPTAPPWAWVDAFDGAATNRWGVDLMPDHLFHEGVWGQNSETEELLKNWRWVGLVFWDRERAQVLLETRALERCFCGWLAPYWARSGRSGL